MVVEGSAQRPGAVDGSTTLEAFWPVWMADARERLTEGTVEIHEYFLATPRAAALRQPRLA